VGEKIAHVTAYIDDTRSVFDGSYVLVETKIGVWVGRTEKFLLGTYVLSPDDALNRLRTDFTTRQLKVGNSRLARICDPEKSAIPISLDRGCSAFLGS